MILAEKRAQLKKEGILRSAMKIIRAVGFQRATMELIAAELLMTKGSLYYYFKNKEEILLECHKLVITDAMERQKQLLNEGKDVWETLEQMIDVHIETALTEKEFFNLLQDPKEAFEERVLQEALLLRKNYQSTFEVLIKRGIEEGAFKVEHVFITRMALLGALNWTQQWYNEEGPLTKGQIKTQFTAVLKKLLV